MAKDPPQIMLIVLANQFVGDKIATGGDVLFVEICRRLMLKKRILIPSVIFLEISKIFDTEEIVVTDSWNGKTNASTVFGGLSIFIRYLIRTLNSSRWIIKHAKDNDKIYLTGDFICNIFPAVVAKVFRPKIKIFANFYHRNPKPSERPGNLVMVSMFSRFLQGTGLNLAKVFAEKTFVLSQTGKDELVKLGFDPNKIVISGAGVNKIKTINTKKKKNQIVFVGRINITKGAFDLVEIISEVVKNNHLVKLIMIGGGSETDVSKLKSKIMELRLQNNIKYIGFVDEVTKNRIISESRLLVLPSKEEGFGIVVSEALANSTPVICYDVPALKTIYSNISAVTFVKRFQKGKFAAKILENISRKKELNFGNINTWDDVYQIQSSYLR